MPRAKTPASAVEQVLERFDPSEDAVTDGDPTYEFMLREKPADLHPVWVHQSDVTSYKAKRYRDARVGSDDVELLCGVTFEEGEIPKMADHQLMVRERGYHEKATERERRANRETRNVMLSKKRTQGDIFVPAPSGNGNGPRAMQQR
jgi:hypothetical protein